MEQKHLPQFIRPMLAVEIKHSFNSKDWVFELKLDGYRLIAQIKQGDVIVYTRNQYIFNSKVPIIVNDLKSIDRELIIDGELVALDDRGIPDFQLLQNLLDHQFRLRYYIFDIISLDGELLVDLPLIERKKILKMLKIENKTVKVIDYIEEKGIEFFDLVIKQGFEGVIAKKKMSKYLIGKRSSNWQKVKHYNSMTAVILGYTLPQKSRQYFGALILGTKNNSNIKFIGKCGTGFSAETQKYLFLKMDKLRKKTVEFIHPLREKIQWIEPILLCEVKYKEITKDGLLRHPVFLGLREDVQ